MGTALGPQGVNIMEFCKAFNAKTSAKDQEGLIIPVVITIFSDRSFTFITKTPPVPVLIKRAVNLAKGSAEPNKNKVGKITLKQVEEIAKIKMPDLNCFDVEAAMNSRQGHRPQHGRRRRLVLAESERSQSVIQRFHKEILSPHHGLIHAQFLVNVIHAAFQNSFPSGFSLGQMLLAQRAENRFAVDQ